MNYHDWAKTASPEANAMSPEITCSACIMCKTVYYRDDNARMFNPLYCPSCACKMAAQTHFNPRFDRIDYLKGSNDEKESERNASYLGSTLKNLFGL